MKKKQKKRLRKYAVGQHDLICEVLKVSPSPDEAGPTALEAVMRLINEIERLKDPKQSAYLSQEEVAAVRNKLLGPVIK